MQVRTDYETAIARKYPERVAIAIAKDATGKHNPITLLWFTRTSMEPPMIAISLGLTRHSVSAVRHAREFVVSLVSTDMLADALYCGSVSGRDTDKFAQLSTKTEKATAIDSLLLADAVANFECRLEGELRTGDHVIFVGRVMAAHQNADPNVRGLYALGHEKFGAVSPTK
jgi:flavin reductase (DIM6/NTAB) family NADH-FMN oxidoreductase RutF